VCGSGDSVLAPESDLAAIFSDEEEGVAVARSFLKVLEVRSADQLQYILLVLGDLLQGDAKRGAVFLSVGGGGGRGVMDPFIRVWARDDISSFCRGKAAICGALILRWSHGLKWKAEHKSLCGFILQCLREWKKDQLLSPLAALKGVISNEVFESVFLAEGGIQKLSHILFENAEHRQVVYLTVFNLWALTLRSNLGASSSSSSSSSTSRRTLLLKEALLNGTLIDFLVQLVKAKVSTKVTRVTLALFEKLVDFENFNEMVILFGLYPVLETMETEQKTDDDELTASVQSLLDSLEKSVRILSSFERYQQEIRAGKLIWGPVHNEAFWKKYAAKMEDDSFKLVRHLIEMLDAEDAQTVAVAAYDIGEWARFYPNGDAKAVVEKLKGKHKLMRLIEHYDAEVRQHALNSLQKILVRNWKMDADPTSTPADAQK